VARVPNFYSVNEAQGLVEERRFHNNSRCGPGSEIPQLDRRNDTGGYNLCEDCRRLRQHRGDSSNPARAPRP